MVLLLDHQLSRTQYGFPPPTLLNILYPITPGPIFANLHRCAFTVLEKWHGPIGSVMHEHENTLALEVRAIHPYSLCDPHRSRYNG